MTRSAHPAPGEARTAEWLVACGGVAVFVTAWVESPTLPEGVGAVAARRFLEESFEVIGWAVTAGAVGLLGMLVFVAGLLSLMRTAEAPGRVLSDLAGLSGVLVAVWIWVQASLTLVPWVLADDEGRLTAATDEAVLSLETLGRLGETLGDLSTVPRGLFVLAVSVLALTTRFLPRWLGWAGLVVAVASLLSVLTSTLTILSVAWFVGLFGFFLWVLLVALVLLVRAARTPRSPRRDRPEQLAAG